MRKWPEVPMYGFGELERAVMDRIWDTAGACTVRQVRDSLHSDHALAYTTVSTVMDKLYRKGHLQRVRAGRAYRYTALVGRDEYVAGLMRLALDGSVNSAQTLLYFVGGLSLNDAATLHTALVRAAEATTSEARSTSASEPEPR